jgi:hypothetical protein
MSDNNTRPRFGCGAVKQEKADMPKRLSVSGVILLLIGVIILFLIVPIFSVSPYEVVISGHSINPDILRAIALLSGGLAVTLLARKFTEGK